MKTLNIPKKHFIGSYFINENVCDNMLKYFWSQKQCHQVTEMNHNEKKCIELGVNPNDMFEPNVSYIHEIKKCILEYIKEYRVDDRMKIDENYNIQHYDINEGFYAWHYERTSLKFANRCLVFMTYLNDVEDGGTEFFHQSIEIKARKCLTLIWPSDFTHLHRGVISKTKQKTIITGWFHLNE